MCRDLTPVVSARIIKSSGQMTKEYSATVHYVI